MHLDAGHLSAAAVMRLARSRGMLARLDLAAGYLAHDILLLRSWGLNPIIPDDLRPVLAKTYAAADLTRTHPALAGGTQRGTVYRVACVLEAHREPLTAHAVLAELLASGWKPAAGDPVAAVRRAATTAQVRYAQVVRVDATRWRWSETEIAS